jgi:hypothetical protein
MLPMRASVSFCSWVPWSTLTSITVSSLSGAACVGFADSGAATVLDFGLALA